MAITSYSTLKTAIAAWTHRADLSTVLDDFIDLTESWLNRDLLVSQSETLYSVAATEYIAFPSGFASIRKVVHKKSPVVELKYVTPAQMDMLADNGTELKHYTVLADQLKLNTTSSTDIEIAYLARLTPLDGTNETNWLITAHPDVYLYGCLAAAFNYIQDDEQAQKYIAMFQETVTRINRLDKSRKFGQSLQVRAA